MVDVATPSQLDLEDVHNQPDDRRLPINHTGISDVHFPLIVIDRNQEKQHTVARLSMSVGLPHYVKGTHMSRFVEAINEYRGNLSLTAVPDVNMKPRYLPSFYGYTVNNMGCNPYERF